MENRLFFETKCRRRLQILMVLFIVAVFSGVSSCASAKESFRIAVIDPQAVIEKSKAGKRALNMLKEHAKARENIMKSDKKELEDLQNELKSSEKTLSQEEFKKKQEVFSRKVQDWQKRGQEYQAELSKKQQEMVNEYMKKIEKATGVVAKRHGFSLVVDKGSETTFRIVLYNRKGLDITNEVVKEFNHLYK